MTINRRDILKTASGIALSTALGGPAFAKSKPKKVLILGGTGFIGPHFVKALMDGGHVVTLFNRGKRDPEAHPGVEQLLGDRDNQLDALKGRDWDAVIDNSGYFPRTVRLSAELLKPRVRQYIYISSIAAYAEFSMPGIDENYRLRKYEGPVVEERGYKTYGAFKVLCENVVNEVYGKNATIIRPTYIAGPGDYTDRFTYWPFRVAQGGEMLAPGTPTVTWAPVEFLQAQGLIAGELVSAPLLPIWDPPLGIYANIGLIRCDRAVGKGLKFRSMEQTIRDTLEWQKTRPAENQVLKAGLKPEREAELLKLLHG
jgi:2'-hydroxyisoflavone reductase